MNLPFDDTVAGPMDDHAPAGIGLPQDRAARLAARRAFVDMKLIFLRATEPLEGRKGDWLRQQVRRAHDPLELWLLRGPVLSALSGDEHRHRGLRAELYRTLDRIFPEAFGFEPDASLPPTLPVPWDALLPSAPRHAVGWA
ncbi:MAG: hypothetical protein HY856_06125 [Burkholderiales bacterium]|jgi:hypothetical protein|nr:hypothetical protein [Burkholderiales bacterium]